MRVSFTPPRLMAVSTLAMGLLLVTSCAQRAFVTHAPLSSDYQVGYMEGLKTADQRGGGPSYGLGAYGASTACCLVGYGVGLFGAVSVAPAPPEALLGRSPAYADGFRAGFQHRSRQNRQSAAYWGAAFGTVTGLAIDLLMGLGGMYTTASNKIDQRGPLRE
jgi:hypothetical protein